MVAIVGEAWGTEFWVTCIWVYPATSLKLDNMDYALLLLNCLRDSCEEIYENDEIVHRKHFRILIRKERLKKEEI